MLYAFSAFLAYFVKGLCGFANTLVFSSILSFWQDNIYITPIDLPLSLISNLLLVFHDHKALSVKIWGSGAFFRFFVKFWGAKVSMHSWRGHALNTVRVLFRCVC